MTHPTTGISQDNYGVMTTSYLPPIKVRIEFDEQNKAFEHRRQYGGHVIITKTERILWYSLGYTRTMVWNDVPGDLTLY